MNNKKIKSRARIIAFGIMLVLVGLVLGFGLLYFRKVIGKTHEEIAPAIAPVLTISICLVVAGLLVIFLKPLLSHKIKSFKKEKQEVDEESDLILEEIYTESDSNSEVIKPIKEDEKTVIAPSLLTPSSPTDLQELSAVNYNATHTLQKARLMLDEEEVRPQQGYGFQKTSAMSAFQSESNKPTPAPVVNEHAPQVNIELQNVSTPIQPDSVFEQPKPAPVVDLLHREQPKAVVKPPFKLPPTNLLDLHEGSDDATANEQSCQDRVALINQIFENLKVGAQAVGYTVGPSVTRYDIQTNADVSVTVINRYVNDISIRLGGIPTRFEPIVFGKATSGLEIPNEIRTNVGLRESIEALPQGEKYLRNIPFGKDISGKLVQANLQDFPHMLVSGTTGSGKSIFVHSTIMTLLMRNTPDQVRLVLVDPKKVEMSYYKDIPHLLCPSISDPKKALVAFRKLVDEMERRYNLFEANRVRDLGSFNRFAKENGIEPLPVIVVFVDEYADLSEACKEIREPVVRIAQKARSAGIHLVIATQRPSVNVIDGVIKANIATHVALMVSNAVDSVTIIGEAGAEQLLGNGDMLVECPLISRAGKPRVQGCFVDTSEINRVCDYLRNNYGPNYDPEFLDLEEHVEESASSFDEPKVIDKSASEDQLYEMIKADVVDLEFCSISYIQRTYGVGFPKAGRMFNKLLKDGYVSRDHDARGSKVLIRTPQGQSTQIGSIEQSSFVPNENLTEETPTETVQNNEQSVTEEIKENDEI